MDYLKLVCFGFDATNWLHVVLKHSFTMNEIYFYVSSHDNWSWLQITILNVIFFSFFMNTHF